jgi:Xaa-Pro aminopeptidase
MSDLDDEKLARLDAYLDDEGLAEVWLLRPQNFAWLTGGNAVVDRAGDVGVAALRYGGDEVRALTANNEADRMREEELPSSVTVDAFDWYETSLAEAVARESADRAATDAPTVPGLSVADVTPLRLPLTDEDRRGFESAGRDAARAVEAVARAVTTEHTEARAAGMLREELWERGMESPVVLVGGAERAQRHRHFTPTDATLGAYGVLTVVAVRDGLNVAVTRTVAFDPPEWLGDHYEAVSRVAATAMAATAEQGGEGGRAGDVFDDIRTAYERVGWEGEWRHHHQGGAIGFESREWTATPGATDPVSTPAPYAWNPTIQGAKTEDTALISAEGVEVLTTTGSWPTTRYEAVDRDVAVELPGLLIAD